MTNVLCHAGATAATSPKLGSPAVRGEKKECSPAERAPKAGPPCGCGTATSKLLPEESHGKKQLRDRRAEPVLPGGCLRARPAEVVGTGICLHFVVFFLLVFFFYHFPLLAFLFVFWNSLDLMVLCSWTFSIAQLNESQSFSFSPSSAGSSKEGRRRLLHQTTGPECGKSSSGTRRVVNGYRWVAARSPGVRRSFPGPVVEP